MIHMIWIMHDPGSVGLNSKKLTVFTPPGWQVNLLPQYYYIWHFQFEDINGRRLS